MLDAPSMFCHEIIFIANINGDAHKNPHVSQGTSLGWSMKKGTSRGHGDVALELIKYCGHDGGSKPKKHWCL
jgi:hypothetical protein